MKMKHASFPLSLCAAFALAAALLHAGCESADGTSVEISPAYSEVTAKGQSVTLVASGWSGYAWSLDNNDNGYLTEIDGNHATYVVTKMPGTTTTVTVTATGTGTGGASSVSNSVGVISATATIGHVVAE